MTITQSELFADHTFLNIIRERVALVLVDQHGFDLQNAREAVYGLGDAALTECAHFVAGSIPADTFVSVLTAFLVSLQYTQLVTLVVSLLVGVRNSPQVHQ
jgi:hypothetical protein